MGERGWELATYDVVLAGVDEIVKGVGLCFGSVRGFDSKRCILRLGVGGA